MKRLINLIYEIRNLEDWHVKDIECEDGYDFPVIKEFEAILQEFYDRGYENGEMQNVSQDIDFSNRLSNFYQFDEP